MIRKDKLIGIFDEPGEYITGDLECSDVDLNAGQEYMFAVNLNYYNSVNNSILVDFFESIPPYGQKYNISEIKIFKEYDYNETLNINSSSQNGTPVDDLSLINQGVAITYFRCYKKERYLDKNGVYSFEISREENKYNFISPIYITANLYASPNLYLGVFDDNLTDLKTPQDTFEI